MSKITLAHEAKRETEEKRIEALLPEVREFVRHQTAAGARVFRGAIRRELATLERPLGLITLSKVLARLEEEGSICSYGKSEGWIAVGVARAALDLGTLVERARQCVDDAYKAPLGRRGNVGDVVRDRRLEKLTPSQFAKILTAAALVSQAVTGGKKSLGQVGPEYFAWNTERCQWELAIRVPDWSRTLRSGEKSTVDSHVDGSEMLLDLAATKGWISRGEQHDHAFQVHAAEWQPMINEWHKRLTGGSDLSDVSTRCVLYGLRELALAATRREWLTCAAANWDIVVEDIHVAMSASPPRITSEGMKNARLAYNKLCAAGIIAGAPWGRHRPPRDGLVPMAAITAALDGDWSKWHGEDGRPYVGLLGRLQDADGIPIKAGDYGLIRYMKWLDERTTQVDFATYDLPPRSYIDADERTMRMQERKKAKGKALFRQRRSSMRQTLVRLNVIAGNLARGAEQRPGVDWTDPNASLVKFATVDTAVAYATHWMAERGRCGKDAQKSCTVADAAFALAQYTSPFAHAIAHAAGDTARAEALKRSRKDIAVFAESYKPQEDQRVRTQRKVAHWEQGGDEAGYLKLGKLVDCLIARIVAYGGGLSLEDQVAAIEAKTFRPKRRKWWATAVRDAAAFHFLWRSPTRAGSLGRLRMAAWESTGTALWEGAIKVNYEQWEVKQSRPFIPVLFHSRYLGDVDAEHAFHRVLFQLLLMPGGARDVLLELADGTKAESPYIFCSSARDARTEAEQEKRIADGLPFLNVSAQFGAHIDRYATELGLDATIMKDGAKGVHVFRHLLASEHFEDLALVQHMLGHASLEITSAIYDDASEQKVVIDDLRVRQEARAQRNLDTDTASCDRSAPPGAASTPVNSAEVQFEVSATAVCVACFTPRRSLDGKLARKCYVCGETQPGQAA